jgi:hypothetical protein
MTEPYFYLFVRQDISLAQQLVQSVHAAVNAGMAFREPIDISNAVLIGVPNKDALHEVVDLLETKNIEYVTWYEPDPSDNPVGFTSVCTISLREKGKRAALSKFPLWTPKDPTPQTVGPF